MGFKNRAIKWGIVFTTAVCIALGSLFLIGFLVNSKPVKARFALEIKKLTGTQIQPETINFTLTPFPGISFLDVGIRFNDQVALTIDRVDLFIDLSGLLKQKISARQIQIHGPRLIYTPKMTLASETTHPLAFDLSQLSVQELIHQVATPLFALVSDSPDPLEIIIKQAKTDYFSTMDARLRVSSNKSGMNLTARIKNVDFYPGQQLPQVDTLTAKKIKAVKAESIRIAATLSSSGILSGDIAVNRPQMTAIGIPDTPLTAPELILNFSLSNELITARIIPTDIPYPKARVGIEFNHRPDTGNTSLAFRGEKIDIAQARAVCLPLIGNIGVVDILFDILRAGLAKNLMVGFNAQTLIDLFDPDNLILEGAVESVRVKIPELPLIVENVTGGAQMKKGVLHIEAQKGVVDSAQIKGGSLDIDLLNYPDEPFTGKFKLTADLSRLPTTLMALLPGTRLASELALISELNGRADGVLELEMPTGPSELRVRVSADKIQASGRYSPVPLPLVVSDGKFDYDTDRITLKDFSGTIGENSVTGLNTEIRFDKTPVLNLELGPAGVSTQELMPWITTYPEITALLSPVKMISGPLNIGTLKIQGPMFSPEKWQVDVTGAAENIALGFNHQKMSIHKLSCTFKIDQNHLEVENLNAVVDGIPWLENKVPPDILSSIKLPISIREGGITQVKETTFLRAGLYTPDGPSIFFNAKGKSWSKMLPELIMIKDGELSDALIIPNQAPDKPIINFEGRLNTLTLEKLLVQDSPLYTKLTSLTIGSPIGVSTDDQSRIHIETTRLNLDTFLSRNQNQNKNQTTETGRPLLAQEELFFKADSLVYQDRSFHQVDSKITFLPQTTKIRINQAALCDLAVRGAVEISHKKKSPLVTTDFDIRSGRQTDVSKVFNCLVGTKSMIEGQYTFTGKITGNDHPDRIMGHQNGNILIEAKNGRIYKATVLSRVLSVLHILGDTDIGQQGFGYKSLTIQADVKNSVIHIKKAYIDADNMAIIASGWIDPINDQLDLTFLVAPLKTIDTIIAHIPLVNTILKGRLISLPAKATGKISAPRVIPLHPSAVGKGLITLFGDLLDAPVRLIQGEKNNE